jgi:hypothetical protein
MFISATDKLNSFYGKKYSQKIENEIKTLFPVHCLKICDYGEYYSEVYLENTIRCYVEQGIIRGIFLEQQD